MTRGTQHINRLPAACLRHFETGHGPKTCDINHNTVAKHAQQVVPLLLPCVPPTHQPTVLLRIRNNTSVLHIQASSDSALLLCHALHTLPATLPQRCPSHSFPALTSLFRRLPV